MNETNISELIAIAKEMNDVAYQVELHLGENDDRAMAIVLLENRLRQVIANLPA